MNTRTSSTLRAATIATSIAALASGCGSGDETVAAQPAAQTAAPSTAPPQATTGESNGPATGRTTRLRLRAPKDRVRFDKRTLQAPAGKVIITLINETPEVHNVTLKGNGVFVGAPNTRGGRTTLRSVLKAGSYTYYCSILGHGDTQRGRLTVS